MKSEPVPLTIDSDTAMNARIVIVRTSYHETYNNNLEHACRLTLKAHGVESKHIHTLVAPGSWEIPLLVQQAAKSGNYDAIIAFGVIIKGDTYHFELIANEVGRSLMQLSLDYSIPIANEILAVLTKKQADARAGNKTQNKGVEGAEAVLHMIQQMRELRP